MNTDFPAENWRPSPYPDYAEYYSVSDHGRVMRTKTHAGNPCTRILKSDNITGYQRVLLIVSGKQKPVLVHVAVALAFLGERPEGCEVNHIDTNKRNNHVSNLEYITHAKNIEHAVANGLIPHGNDHHKSILTDTQILEIRNGYEHNSGSIRRLASKYGVSANAIRSALQGKSWKHLPNVNADTNISSWLDTEKAQLIRQLHQAGHKQVDLARMYGVSPAYISLIVNGKRRLTTTESANS